MDREDQNACEYCNQRVLYWSKGYACPRCGGFLEGLYREEHVNGPQHGHSLTIDQIREEFRHVGQRMPPREKRNGGLSRRRE